MKNEKMITNLGLAKVMANGDYKRGDFHQAIMNVAYNDWQDHNNALIYQLVESDTKVIAFEGTAKECDEWSKDKPTNNYRNMKIKDGEKQWSYGDMLDNARDKYGELFYVMVMVGKYNQQVCNGGHVQYYDNACCQRDGGCMSTKDPKIPLHKEMLKAFKESIMPLVTYEDVKTTHAAYDIMKSFKKIKSDTLDDRWYEIDDEFMEVMNKIAGGLISEYDNSNASVHYIALALKMFNDEFKNAMEDGNHAIPTSDEAYRTMGEAAKECYDLLAGDNIRYKCIEAVMQDGVITHYIKHPAKHAREDLRTRVKSMEEGDTLSYWEDIADAYDLEDSEGGTRQDIAEAYDDVLVNMTEHGYLIQLHDDENDEEVTTGYQRTSKK